MPCFWVAMTKNDWAGSKSPKVTILQQVGWAVVLIFAYSYFQQSLHTILDGYGEACNILPRCVQTSYHCLYTCLSYCVNLLHVINYLIFDSHGQEFKISNGNNKNNTNQSVNIFSSVTVKRLFCQSVCSIGQSVNQSVPQSVTLRGQIFAELIFRIYDLIRKIKFHKFKKYPIFSDKTLSFSK